MKKLKNKPSIIFVDDVNLLNARRRQTIICSLSEDGVIDENSFFKTQQLIRRKCVAFGKESNLD